MGTQRLERIAEHIQRELADLIRLEVRDPRVRFVTLTAVELARDQGHAKVYFTTMGPPEDAEAALAGLTRAAGFLRSALSHRLTTRGVPALHFAYDASIERGARLTRLIDEAVAPPPPKRRRAPAAKGTRSPARRKAKG